MGNNREAFDESASPRRQNEQLWRVVDQVEKQQKERGVEEEGCLPAGLDRRHRCGHQENESKTSQPRRSLRAMGRILSAIHCYRYRVRGVSCCIVSHRGKVPGFRLASMGNSWSLTTPRRRRRRERQNEERERPTIAICLASRVRRRGER